MFWKRKSVSIILVWTLIVSVVSADYTFGTLTNLGPPVSSVWNEAPHCMSTDGLTLYFGSDDRPGGPGGGDLWVTRRATVSDAWEEPMQIEAINSTYADLNASVTADELSLFFMSNRPGGYGDFDIWVTTRATTSDPWRSPVNLGPPINSSAYDQMAMISPEDSILIFGSYRSSGHGSCDIWQVPIIVIVDFNGDGHVNCIDICDLVAHWGTDNSLYDIGPMPWGDGIVNEKDLLVLAEHMVEISDANEI